MGLGRVGGGIERARGFAWAPPQPWVRAKVRDRVRAKVRVRFGAHLALLGRVGVEAGVEAGHEPVVVRLLGRRRLAAPRLRAVHVKVRVRGLEVPASVHVPVGGGL